MKPFDLQKALAGEPVITRDGRPVKIAGYNEEADEDVVLCGWVAGNAHQWYKDGSCEYEEYLDLFMAPIERKEWVVRCAKDDYKVQPNFMFYNYYDAAISEADRLQRAFPDFNTTIHEITITE
jgi:hypothetical protein